MPTYYQPTGTSGQLILVDDGYNLQAIIRCSNASTFANGVAWTVTLGGGSATGTVNINGVGDHVVWTGATSVSVGNWALYMGATGTSGMGGPSQIGPTNITRATVPPAPSAPYYSNIGPTTMRTQFNSQGDGGAAVDQWQLQRALDASFTSGLVTVTSGGTTDWTGLAKGTRYYHRARGHNSVGWGAWSPTTSAVTLIEPSTPVAPVLKSYALPNATITVVDPSNGGAAISARELQISRDPNFDPALTSTVNPTAAGDLTYGGFVRNMTYYFRYRVQNSVGWSPYSPTGTGVIPGSVPSAPTGYSAYDIASGSFTVGLGTISDNGGAVPKQVRVKVSTTASDTGLIGTFTMDTWNPVFITGLSANTQYYIAEAAWNDAIGGGWGAYGAWTSVTTKNNVPNAPALSSSAQGSSTITMNWVAPTVLNGATIQSYTLRVATDKAMTQNVRDIVVIGSLSQVVDQLTAATNYYFQIWTNNDTGRGSSSAVVAVATTGGGSSTLDGWLNVTGTWKQFELWLNVVGTWKSCELWENQAGTWKQVM